ncbi:PTS sugar transporter [Colwellia sp. MT41]|uniref:PTS IIA-like nitrogen-regulatory protein PtsN n=1 Tax=Colwellia marinimaniae TaxID=1513592 RepID=A0ABQ0MPZ3_9GAMM|nr:MULTISPECIES: PTS IIA-like nitrogen regulatory protein PtsN [Colwellia]ALO36046.1 PTS sugar transporter [Colwellia sp. MT41]GAW94440.1 PTS IIA-like nitrogen-regulatory protein PtsN [Colwellia marinimaniae]
MQLSEILTTSCTTCDVEITSKKRILEKICQLAAKQIGDIEQDDLLESLLNREKMGSTGIGNGIAIPHGRLPNANKAVAVLITTEQAIDFDAIDNRNVDVFIALFVPENSCKEHLITLQSIAKLFSNKKMIKRVRKCHDNQALYNLIQQASNTLDAI